MSENQETTTLVNNELTDRLNKAYIAKNFTLLNGGTDNIIMAKGEKDGETVDMLFIYNEIKSVLEDLEPDTVKKNDAAQSNEL